MVSLVEPVAPETVVAPEARSVSRRTVARVTPKGRKSPPKPRPTLSAKVRFQWAFNSLPVSDQVDCCLYWLSMESGIQLPVTISCLEHFQYLVGTQLEGHRYAKELYFRALVKGLRESLKLWSDAEALATFGSDWLRGHILAGGRLTHRQSHAVRIAQMYGAL